MILYGPLDEVDTDDDSFWNKEYLLFQKMSLSEQMAALGLELLPESPPEDEYCPHWKPRHLFRFSYWPESTGCLQTWGTKSDPIRLLFFLHKHQEFLEEIGQFRLSPGTFGGWDVHCLSGWTVRFSMTDSIRLYWDSPRGFHLKVDVWDTPRAGVESIEEALELMESWGEKMRSLARNSLAILDM